ncbi:MAG: class II aldolase/adducin family protein [Anaerolineales bacterium]|nr:class II aldolase/adducin family protein [Anaerolineales bacterium]MCS7247398.1 class II aldolase/adducin family protein [Anaerolineales bacterium]MDW8161209.1 class II aldolase/adducin family protein [Anaerolineales bacterium]MDW8448261.1 class II aldolase/adducin family protein [Anaerolineales bacterium]
MKVLAAKLRKEMVRAVHQLAQSGLSRSSDGNVSVRLSESRILITPSGAYKAWLEPHQIVEIDMEGNLCSPYSSRKPSSEYFMHLTVYRHRPDVRAVIHAHPPHAVALTLIGQPFPTEIVPEGVAALGEVPTIPYARPGTAQMGERLEPYLRDYDVLLLDHHGSLTLGKTLEEALVKLERLEAVAQLWMLAKGAGEIIPLPEAERQHLMRSSLSR